MTLKERIQNLCREKGIALYQLERTLGFGNGYISKLDKSTPNVAKIKKIADYFGVSVDYLMNGEDSENVEKYHFDEETAQMAQEMFENKDMRVLFKTARNAKPEDLKIVNDMLIALMKKENPDYDEGC